MAKSNWHITTSGSTLTLSRAPKARFDLAVETTLPLAPALVVAHQIRQDMWRLLQRLRGFQPVVQIDTQADVLHVTARGAIAGRYPQEDTCLKLLALLENPAHRLRWITHANRGLS